MKKRKFAWLSVLWTILFCALLAVPCAAEDINLSDEINDITAYYYDRYSDTLQSGQSDPEAFRPYIADSYSIVPLLSVNLLNKTEQVISITQIEDSADAFSYAQLLIQRLALDLDPHADFNGLDPLAHLSELQQPDGSFAGCTLSENIFCFIALRAAQTRVGESDIVYSSRNANNYLLGLQGQDGSWESDAVVTAWALTYLSYFTETVSDCADAVDRGVAYLQSQQQENGLFAGHETAYETAVIVCGLTDAGESLHTAQYHDLPVVMKQFKNEDASYRTTLDGEHTADLQATAGALAAFDGVANQQSCWMKLMQNGSFSDNLLQKLWPVLVIFGILAALSVVFWCFMLFGKLKFRHTDEGGSILKNPEGMTRAQLEEELAQQDDPPTKTD